MNLDFKDIAKSAKQHVIDAMNDKGFETLQKQVKIQSNSNGFKVIGSDGVYWANFGRPSEKQLGRITKLPPSKEIADWMERKGIPADRLDAIRYHIKKFGTKGHFYLQEPLDKIIEETSDFVGDEIIAKIKMIDTNDYEQNT